MLIFYITLMSTVVPILMIGYVVSVILDLTRLKIFFVDTLVWGSFPFCLPVILVYYVIHEHLEKKHQCDMKKIIFLEERLNYTQPKKIRK
jgi:hypothetical protein